LGLLAAAKRESQANEAWAAGLAALQAHLVKQEQFAKAAIVKAEREKLAAKAPPENPRP
jgi:hypothetical protein